MPGPSCTEDALEAFDEHSDAQRALLKTVLTAIEDREVTDEERLQIARTVRAATKTTRQLHVAVEKCHHGLTMARSYLWTGEATPKLERKDRELRAGIVSLEDRYAERDGSPLPAA